MDTKKVPNRFAAGSPGMETSEELVEARIWLDDLGKRDNRVSSVAHNVRDSIKNGIYLRFGQRELIYRVMVRLDDAFKKFSRMKDESFDVADLDRRLMEIATYINSCS